MRRTKGLSFYRRRKKISTTIVHEILSYVAGILIAAFLAFVIVYFVGIRTSVIGVSMEPALYNGQEILINRFAYKLANPRAGDVVVFLPNGNQNTHYYVKRVVAGPGETVQIREGILYVNGKAVEDDTYDLIADAGIAEHEIKLGNDEYFVRGITATAVKTAAPAISARFPEMISWERPGLRWRVEAAIWDL